MMAVPAQNIMTLDEAAHSSGADLDPTLLLNQFTQLVQSS
jgi:hypothetical protein